MSKKLTIIRTAQYIPNDLIGISGDWVFAINAAAVVLEVVAVALTALL